MPKSEHRKAEMARRTEWNGATIQSSGKPSEQYREQLREERARARAGKPDMNQLHDEATNHPVEVRRPKKARPRKENWNRRYDAPDGITSAEDYLSRPYGTLKADREADGWTR